MKILITGGAGFIGSNLCEYFLQNHQVICLDNFSTGYRHNIESFLLNSSFELIEGDIRNIETCRKAVQNVDYVFHQAALGSVPRSIDDPITTNSVNIDGFLNMLVAARDAGVKRFIYAASSSTYGDSKELPKVEENIGKPLSPYAITKYVNELYAQIFTNLYGIETIGLRYFNVFGKRQNPNGSYAAVIPLFIKCLIKHERPIINGDGSYSRDFTYIDNVIQANELAMVTSTNIILERLNTNENSPKITQINIIINVASGGKTTLNELFTSLRSNLSCYDPIIADIKPIYGIERLGDIPHSQASIEKAKNILSYQPKCNTSQGLEFVCKWYFENLK
ncbi:unnamed protein product [Adineta ricciae]|uniref:NAD-dependent epimerase/dehydratase domain-containing protein n=1 Tax=Adineta ricciae TaxID=249248 RepID=A0A815LDE1_ADIRI|nr:unnamed protein product [Adineta ricciae]